MSQGHKLHLSSGTPRIVLRNFHEILELVCNIETVCGTHGTPRLYFWFSLDFYPYNSTVIYKRWISRARKTSGISYRQYIRISSLSRAIPGRSIQL